MAFVSFAVKNTFDVFSSEEIEKKRWQTYLLEIKIFPYGKIYDKYFEGGECHAYKHFKI